MGIDVNEKAWRDTAVFNQWRQHSNALDFIRSYSMPYEVKEYIIRACRLALSYGVKQGKNATKGK